MRKFPKADQRPTVVPEDLLRKLYLDEGLSAYKISTLIEKEYKTTPAMLYYFMKGYNIPRRSKWVMGRYTIDGSLTGRKPKYPIHRSQLVSVIAEYTKLTRKTVDSCLRGLIVVAIASLKATGEFTIPDLAKLTVVVKPAKPAGKRYNRWTKEMVERKALPERKVVKARSFGGITKALNAPPSEDR